MVLLGDRSDDAAPGDAGSPGYISTRRKLLLLLAMRDQNQIVRGRRRRGPVVVPSSGRRLWLWQRRLRRLLTRKTLHNGHELVRSGVDDPRRSLVHDHRPSWCAAGAHAGFLGRPRALLEAK
jgi:hypothetical protein